MRRLCAPWLILALMLMLGQTLPGFAAEPDASAPVEEKKGLGDVNPDGQPDKGDTAWMLVSSAFVMLMVPGLALFYGGMVRRKNMLATMMQSIGALAIVGVYWVVVGYSLAFGPPAITLGGPQNGIIGWSWDLVCMKGVRITEILPNNGITIYAHMLFQGMFAIITPALISGAIAERIRFVPYVLFMILWVTFVYCPLAHMVWAMDWFQAVDPVAGPGKVMVGVLGYMGALDFAGGTVVHISAGFAGLAGALVLRKRMGYPTHPVHPSSMVLTLTGAALLWFGWFGFNGGSAVASGALATGAFAATQAAAAAAGLSWCLVEYLTKGKATALGLASGIVAGLVAVTPASGFVYIWGGLLIGVLAGVVCYAAVYAKTLMGYDDSLDAFGVHGIGGVLGALLTGVFCYKIDYGTKESPYPWGLDGMIASGTTDVLFTQVIAVGVSVIFAFVVSAVLFKVIDMLCGFTTTPAEETEGLDQTEHGETGFDFSIGSEGGTPAYATFDPKPATTPPNGKTRFTLVVDGGDPTTIMKVWSEVCQPGVNSDADFAKLYPNLTTVSGNRFKFRGGDAKAASKALETLLQKRLGRTPVTIRIES